MILELSDQVLNLRNEVAILGVSVVFDDEVRVLPGGADVSDRLQDGGLTSCLRGDLLDTLEVCIDASLKELIQVEVQQGAWWTIYKLPDVVPMLLLHRWITKCLNEVAMSGDVLDLGLRCVEHFVLPVVADLGLELDQCSVLLLDSLDDGGSILLSEVVAVPSLLLLAEGLPDVPELVSHVVLVLEVIDLWDACLWQLQCVLVSRVLCELADALIEPLADLGRGLEGFLCRSLRSDELLVGGHVFNEGLDLLLLFDHSPLELFAMSTLGLSRFLVCLEQDFLSLFNIRSKCIDPALQWHALVGVVLVFVLGEDGLDILEPLLLLAELFLLASTVLKLLDVVDVGWKSGRCLAQVSSDGAEAVLNFFGLSLS